MKHLQYHVSHSRPHACHGIRSVCLLGGRASCNDCASRERRLPCLLKVRVAILPRNPLSTSSMYLPATAASSVGDRTSHAHRTRAREARRLGKWPSNSSSSLPPVASPNLSRPGLFSEPPPRYCLYVCRVGRRAEISAARREAAGLVELDWVFVETRGCCQSKAVALPPRTLVLVRLARVRTGGSGAA